MLSARAEFIVLKCITVHFVYAILWHSMSLLQNVMSLKLSLMDQVLPTLRSCEAEMDEMVVMGVLDLEVQLA